MERAEVLSLLRHMEWADASAWKTTAALPDATRDRRLRELWYHLHTVQWVYLQVGRGQAPNVPELASFPDLPAIATWARAYYRELFEFAGTIGDGELSQELRVPWAAEVAKRYGSAAPATLGEAMLQVVLHSTYHRGQIATRVRELGGEPAVTDFIAWVWQHRPAAHWA